MLSWQLCASVERPNILIILADDLGFSDPGCYGGEIHTPNLDRLARQGIRFTAMRNAAKCFPSRASLLTGVYHHQSDSTDPSAPMHHAVTLGEVLDQAGYRTLVSGKHHSSVNLYDRGFDRAYGLLGGACNHFNPGLRREGEPEPARKGFARSWVDDALVFNTRNPAYQQYFPPGFYSTDAFADKAIEYLDAYGAGPEPFLLYLSFTAPHDPLMAPPEDIARYAGVYESGYAAIRQARYAKLIDEGLFNPETAPLSPAAHADWESLSPSEKAEEARRMQIYAAMIHRMDARIGDVLDKLEEVGALENTLILFASDNGASHEVNHFGDLSAEIGGMERYASLGPDWANVSNTPFRYFKFDSYEGGILTPFIAFWPKGIVNPGRISDRSSHFIDIMPTLIELSGASYPESHNGEPVVPLQGESFVDVLKDKAASRSGPLFFQWSSGRAVIDGEWKLVSKDGSWALYDLAGDRTELVDLKETNPGLFLKLRSLFSSWFESVSSPQE
jgi:arylsulfatase